VCAEGVEALSFDQWEREQAPFDRSAAATQGISRFCSSHAWVGAAQSVRTPGRESLILREGEAWVALAMGEGLGMRRAVLPLEGLWGFGSSLLGPSPSGAAGLLAAALHTDAKACEGVFLTGLPETGALRLGAERVLRRHYRVFPIEGVPCLESDLTGGWESFIARRSRKFRAGLLRSLREAGAAGITSDYLGPDALPDAPTLLRRILQVEQRSWKWGAGESIFQEPGFMAFYDGLLKRSLGLGQVRATFVREGGRDIGYAFGSRFGSTFRGHQMAFAESRRRAAPGNLAQAGLIKGLCAEGGVSTYDLGMAIDYKRRWADRELRLVNLLGLR